MELMNGHKMRYFILNIVTLLVVGFVIFVASLANVIPVLGQILFVGVLIATSILPTIVQVLFITEIDKKSKKVVMR
jgi:hypothetical protein